MKQKKEARLQCQETQTQIRVSGWHSLESAPQGDTDCVQLRTSESVKNGQAPVRHHQQGWGLPRDQSWLSPICHRPLKMARFQRMLQGLTEADLSPCASAHIASCQASGLPRAGPCSCPWSKSEHRSMGPSYHESEQVQGDLPTTAHTEQGGR